MYEERAALAGGDVPPVADPVRPTGWRVVGPFHAQREGDVDYLAGAGGEHAVATGGPAGPAQSALAGGGTVEWTAPGEEEPGSASVSFADAVERDGDCTPLYGGEDDAVQAHYGRSGAGRPAWYAYAEFELDAPRRAAVETDARVCWVNGRRHEDGPRGEEENYSTAPPPVLLRGGTNRVLLRGTVDRDGLEGDLSVTFRPPRAPVEVAFPDRFRGEPQNAILPDVVAGERTDAPASVRVTNTTASELEATVTVGGDVEAVETAVDPPLAPLETRRIETRLRSDGDLAPSPGGGENEDGPTVELGAEAAGERDARELPLRVRAPDDPRRRETFRATDGAVSEYSLVEPSDPGDAPGCVLSLHGANVPSIIQANSNERREDAWICAAAGRGPLNFNHDGFGRVDDVEALDVFSERYDVDPDRTYVAGHSMGGHGTWHVGLTHAGRFAGIAPAAGYMEIDRYVPTPFARRTTYGEEPMGSIRRRSCQHLLALPKTENAADGTLPAFVLHGGRDASVGPVQARTMLRGLANRGLDVRGEVGERYPDPDPESWDAAYLEVPGRGHWWNDDLTDRAEAVNHPDRWSYLLDCERPACPERVRFVTWNLRVEHEKRWVAVREQREAYRRTLVDARALGEGVSLEAENVGVLTLDPVVFEERDVAERVRVDGAAAPVPAGDGPVFVDLRDGLSVSRSDPRDPDGPRKGPDQYGPLSEVVLSPYRIVYGTAGGRAETAANREVALLEGRRLVDRARSHGTVVPDTAVDEATAREHNLLLVGRPGTNAVHDRFADGLPVSVERGAVAVGDRTYEGDLAAKFVHPNPVAPDRLVGVYAGATLAGTRLLRRDPRVPSYGRFDELPDFHVYGDRVRAEGWNGCRAAGFFDREWAVDESLAAFR
ncbi:MAG: prolyl oligopeptidase family serine peptidase [Halobacteriaceae archaeon]